ncbi:MAG: PorT family protein [Prevotellaceae bacterium]|jgi:hypothetical protein|nr:PorT family protein [Prevotellaceae bacterium]
MKKICFLSLCIALVCGASAQRLGGIVGAQLTTPFPVVGGYNVDFNARSGAGFHAGALFEWDITGRFGVDVAAQYSLRSYSFNLHYTSEPTTIFHRQLYYLDIPVHAYLRIPLSQGIVLAPFAGASFSLGLHGKDMAWLDNETQKPVGKETSELFGKDKRLTRAEIAGDVGVALKYKNYQWRASYALGLNNLTKQDFDWYIALNSKQSKYLFDGVFKLSFAYLFDLRK